MRKAMRKNLLRAITGSIGRFLSIFLIVALGCGFYAGVKATGPDMRETADQYFDDSKLMDLHVMSPVGFSRENVDALAALDDVAGVMPSRQTTLSTRNGSENLKIRVQSYTGDKEDEYLNQLTVVDGRLPRQADECVVEQLAITHDKYTIGQQIVIYQEDPSTPSILTETEFTVVGSVDTPSVISAVSSSGALGSQEPDYRIFVTNEAFASDIYTDIYITVAGVQDLICYEDLYTDRIDDVTPVLEEELQKLSGIAGEWIFWTDRTAIAGYTTLKDDSARVDAISTVFPVFFFVVAALVSLTTMTRMVDEERTQIGALKSLGYARSAIALKYTSYAAIASTFGGLVGLLIGFQLFPRVIYNAYLIIYRMPPMHPPFRPALAWVTLTVAVICTTAAALFAILSSLHATPATLLRPKAPRIGKRVLIEKIPFIWNHMDFTKKVTARNLLRYKKRFLMTVVGIAGCTALILSGFGLKNSVTGLVDKQFGKIMLYDLQIMLYSPIEDPYADATYAWLSDSPDIKQVTPLYAQVIDVKSAKSEDAFGATLMVPTETDKFDQYVRFYDRTAKKTLTLTDSGVIISEKLARMKQVGIGDTITIEGGGQKEIQVTVSGICENYTFHYVYMTPSLFADLYGYEAPVNAAFALLEDSSEEAIEAFQEDLSDQQNIAGTIFIPLVKEDLSNVFVSLDYVIAVLILSAFALAVVVLYNLTNININERVREIATIKVLGFYDMEVSAYVFRENAIITILGAGLGLVLGTILHFYIIETAEIDSMMFQREILTSSYLISFGLTVLFSLLVNIIMHFYLRRISMVESLKSVE
jgi:putative ABC transport system permease protein